MECEMTWQDGTWNNFLSVSALKSCEWREREKGEDLIWSFSASQISSFSASQTSFIVSQPTTVHILLVSVFSRWSRRAFMSCKAWCTQHFAVWWPTNQRARWASPGWPPSSAWMNCGRPPSCRTTLVCSQCALMVGVPCLGQGCGFSVFLVYCA